MDLVSLDKNFSHQPIIDNIDCKFYDIRKKPFEIHGLIIDYDNSFRRMKQTDADNINDGVSWLSGDTSGGRVRFSTDCDYVALKVKMPYLTYPHQPLSGSAGFSLFIDENGKSRFFKGFIPPNRFNDEWQYIIRFSDKKVRNLTIWFPTYSHVLDVKIGLNKNAYVGKNTERYRKMKPVVFYGGSHVQGGCASSPSNCYPGFLSRWFNLDFYNLAFSGSALGEKEMAKYVAEMDMSIFVMDYDHNAPSPEYLRKTHYSFYKIIREKHPDIPIIMVSKHDFYTISYYVRSQQENVDRRQVVIDSYERAKCEGDKNVYFLDGKTLLERDDGDCGTVDGTHPNDLGFYMIAQAFKPIIEKLLKEN